MAVQWGSQFNAGNNGMTLGLDAHSGWGVDTNSSQWAFTLDLWTRNRYNYSGDTQRLTLSGDASGTFDYTNSQPTGNESKRGSTAVYYNYPANSYGSSPGSLRIRSTISLDYAATGAWVEITVAVPARPYAAPNAPTWASAARNSDTQATITWGHNITAQRPVHSAQVERIEFNGSTWGGWTRIADIGGTPSSYVDTTIRANRIYRYRVQHWNSTAGYSGYAETDQISTTPAAPTGVVAAMQSGGGRIDVSWTNAAYVTGENTFDVERSIAGGAWTRVVSGLGYATTKWTDTAPGAGLNQYRVRVCRTYAGTTICSDFTDSNTVTTIVAPLGPVNLAPTGSVDLANLPTTLTWTHRDGGDGAAQTQYRIRYYSDKSQTWTVLAEVSSATSQHLLPAGTLANGDTYQWQVQTMGVASAGWGPYSASAVVTATTAPTVTLTEPTEGQVLNLPPVRAAWTYAQAEGGAQAAWEAELSDTSGNVLEFRTGTGATAAVEFRQYLQDGDTYRVRVRARSGQGVWSAWSAQRTVVIDILPPAEVEVTGAYDACTGSAMLTLLIPEPEPGVSEEIVRCDIERSIDDGPWEQIVEGLDTSDKRQLSLTDPLPSTCGRNRYRAVAWSAMDMTSVSAATLIEGTDGRSGSGLWVFVNHGPGFGTVLRVHNDPSVKANSARSRDSFHVQGRRLPYPVLGQGVSRELSVSATIARPVPDCDDLGGGCKWDSPRDEWEAAAWDSGLACFRDWTGRRMFGLIGDVECTTVEGALGLTGLSFAFYGTEDPTSQPSGVLAASGFAPAPAYRTEVWR